MFLGMGSTTWFQSSKFAPSLQILIIFAQCTERHREHWASGHLGHWPSGRNHTTSSRGNKPVLSCTILFNAICCKLLQIPDKACPMCKTCILYRERFHRSSNFCVAAWYGKQMHTVQQSNGYETQEQRAIVTKHKTLKNLAPKMRKLIECFVRSHLELQTRTLMKRSFSEVQHSSNNHTSHLSAS